MRNFARRSSGDFRDDDALRALTANPAEVLGVDQQLGTVEVGKIANLVVADGDLFDKGDVITTWVNGKPYEIKSEPIATFVGQWKLSAAEPIGNMKHWRLTISGKPEKPSASINRLDEPAEQKPTADATDESKEAEPGEESSDETKKPRPEAEAQDSSDEAEDEDDASDDEKGEVDAEIAAGQSELKIDSFKLAGYRITGIFPGEKFGAEGKLTFTATLIQNDGDQKLSGIFRLADGVEVPFTGVSEEQESDKEEDTKKEADEDEKPVDNSDDGDTEKPKKESKDSKLDVAINYPLGAFGLEKTPQQEHLALVNATVWTCADEGMLKRATVLIESGKITAVGKDVEIPEGVKKIDCAGKHVTPGIIDCHSHAASDGGMNEMGDAITAEVRIADFVDPNDITIYRQLAGGVTAANLLHGSGNPIGGQSQVVKFRWGDGAKK